MTSSRKVSNDILAITIAGILLTTTIFTMSSNSQSVFAQQAAPQPAQPQLPPQQQQQQNAPLNFYLKLANNASTAQAASQAAANGTGAKNMTITVNVQKGPGGQQIPLPISAMVPANIQPQDLQLCASLADGSESCQPLSGGQQGASIDLTQSAAGAGVTPAPMGTASPMPAPAPAPPTGTMSPPMPAPAPQSYPNNGGAILANAINPIVEAITSTLTVQYANAQLISVEDTTVNIPITVIVPIDLNIQNAQVCASVLSEGAQSCTQVVLNPTQTSYTDVNVDLSSATPTLTTAEQEPTTGLTTTTAEPTTTATQPLATTEPTATAPTTTTEPTAPTTTTEPTAPTEEPTAEIDTQDGGTTTQEPTTEGSTSDGGSQ
jgi:hypothetical protein